MTGIRPSVESSAQFDQPGRIGQTGWWVRPEGRLLPPDLKRLLGYAPRADIVLERLDDSLRLWVEFEVSRADPVANHAKFATAHLFCPQAPADRFLAMVSPHVTRGRRNLAFNAVALMRQVGMKAFQTVLFPELAPPEVQRLNQLAVGALSRRPSTSTGRSSAPWPSRSQ